MEINAGLSEGEKKRLMPTKQALHECCLASFTNLLYLETLLAAGITL